MLAENWSCPHCGRKLKTESYSEDDQSVTEIDERILVSYYHRLSYGNLIKEEPYYYDESRFYCSVCGKEIYWEDLPEEIS